MNCHERYRTYIQLKGELPDGAECFDITKIKIEQRVGVDLTQPQPVRLASKLNEVPIVIPILVDDDNNVVACEALVLAMRHIGCGVVPANKQSNMTVGELQSYANAIEYFVELARLKMSLLRDDIDRVRAIAACIVNDEPNGTGGVDLHAA